MNVERHSTAQHEAPSFDAWQIASAFRAHRKLFAAIFLGIMAVTLFIVLSKTPQYESTATILIDQHKQQLMKDDAFLSALPGESSIVDTEVQIIQSRAIAANVTRRLHLDSDPEFAPTAKPGLLGSARRFVKSLFGKPKPADPDVLFQQTVDNVAAGLDVERVGETFVISISFTSEDPKKASVIANEFAAAYLAGQAQAKFGAVKQMTDWLSSQLLTLQSQAQHAATELQNYKSEHNLVDVSANQTLMEQEVSALDQQLQLAQADEAEHAARLAAARTQVGKGGDGGNLAEALNSAVVQALRAQLSVASQRLADLEGRYGPRHPEMLKAKRAYSDIENQIKNEVGRIISNLEVQVQVSHHRVASLQTSIDKTKRDLGRASGANADASVLALKAQASAAQYQAFLERVKQGTAMQGMEPTDARIVSRADIPSAPSSPRVMLDLALGAMIALLLGLVAIGIAGAMRGGFQSEDDVERSLGLPSLGIVPVLAMVAEKSEMTAGISPPDYVIDQPRSVFAESFRTIRASLLHGRPSRPVKLVAVTSAMAGEGKTTTALCLAHVSSLCGTSTVIVDCDLAHRGVNKYLQQRVKTGLIDVLDGTAMLDSCLIKDQRSGAHILPAGRGPRSLRDLLTSPEMELVLDRLRHRFDLIILDTGPVLFTADARAVAAMADAVVLVTQWRKTPRKMAEACVKAFTLADAYVAGVVLSRADPQMAYRAGYGRYAARYNETQDVTLAA